MKSEQDKQFDTAMKLRKLLQTKFSGSSFSKQWLEKLHAGDYVLHVAGLPHDFVQEVIKLKNSTQLISAHSMGSLHSSVTTSNGMLNIPMNLESVCNHLPDMIAEYGTPAAQKANSPAPAPEAAASAPQAAPVVSAPDAPEYPGLKDSIRDFITNRLRSCNKPELFKEIAEQYIAADELRNAVNDPANKTGIRAGLMPSGKEGETPFFAIKLDGITPEFAAAIAKQPALSGYLKPGEKRMNFETRDPNFAGLNNLLREFAKLPLEKPVAPVPVIAETPKTPAPIAVIAAPVQKPVTPVAPKPAAKEESAFIPKHVMKDLRSAADEPRTPQEALKNLLMKLGVACGGIADSSAAKKNQLSLDVGDSIVNSVVSMVSEQAGKPQTLTIAFTGDSQPEAARTVDNILGQVLRSLSLVEPGYNDKRRLGDGVERLIRFTLPPDKISAFTAGINKAGKELDTHEGLLAQYAKVAQFQKDHFVPHAQIKSSIHLAIPLGGIDGEAKIERPSALRLEGVPAKIANEIADQIAPGYKPGNSEPRKSRDRAQEYTGGVTLEIPLDHPKIHSILRELSSGVDKGIYEPLRTDIFLGLDDLMTHLGAHNPKSPEMKDGQMDVAKPNKIVTMPSTSFKLEPPANVALPVKTILTYILKKSGGSWDATSLRANPDILAMDIPNERLAEFNAELSKVEKQISSVEAGKKFADDVEFVNRAQEHLAAYNESHNKNAVCDVSYNNEKQEFKLKITGLSDTHARQLARSLSVDAREMPQFMTGKADNYIIEFTTGHENKEKLLNALIGFSKPLGGTSVERSSHWRASNRDGGRDGISPA